LAECEAKELPTNGDSVEFLLWSQKKKKQEGKISGGWRGEKRRKKARFLGYNRSTE